MLQRILFLMIFLAFGCKSYHPSTLVLVDAELKSIDGLIKSDAGGLAFKLDSLVNPYKLEIGDSLKSTIGYNPRFMSRSFEDWDTLNQKFLWNWVTDAVFFYARDVLNWETDVCLLNKGGLRKDLSHGSISLEDIYELLPFDNYLCLVELSQEGEVEMLDYLKQNLQPHNGLRMGFLDQSAKLPSRINLTSHEHELRVLTINYLAEGGDGMHFFKNGKINCSNVLIRDAVINYLKNHPEYKVKIDERNYVLE